MTNINQNLCVGCGMCVNTCPDVFELNSEGKAIVISDKNKECAKNAEASCPVNAISVK